MKEHNSKIWDITSISSIDVSLHLHEIVEGLYFHCSLSVCLCVCLSVCLSVCPVNLVNKIPAERMHRLDAVFAKWLLLALAQTLLNLVTLGQRSRSQWPITIIFLHNSLLTFLPCISVLLCLIKMKFSMSLRYTLGRFVFKFHEIRMGYDVIMTSFKFSPNNCPYLKFYWTYKLRTWNQYTTI